MNTEKDTVPTSLLYKLKNPYLSHTENILDQSHCKDKEDKAK